MSRTSRDVSFAVYGCGVLHLVLWDVDNTLIDNAGVSKQIYAAAFRRLRGRDVELPARTEGRTDPRIMADLLERNGEPHVTWPEAHIALTVSGEEHEQSLAIRGRVLPGVVRALTVLRSRSDVVQSVVTGNIRANALVKLRALGLDGYVDMEVSGCGSDHEDRAELVTIAIRRAAEKFGQDGQAMEAVVIGDTPRDVEAGIANGVRVLGVASGVHGTATLERAGASKVVPDLTDLDAIVSFVYEVSDSQTAPGTG